MTRLVDAESDLQLAALLPEQKVLMAFDLVFSSDQHAFTGANHFDHWIIVLERDDWQELLRQEEHALEMNVNKAIKKLFRGRLECG